MIRLTIKGMTCMHCVSAVKKALEAVPGVKRAEVSLDKGQAVVEGEPDPQALLAAVRDEGYEAQIAG
ncbi:MAG TPA: heavy metal-binding protein [Chromatiales bacterium]|nr:heavy metal-binding protein [Chromatiales bacterium]